jgi:hypothetical protein
MKKKKYKDVQKFGGKEDLGSVKFNGNTHEASSLEVTSDTKLEHDEGYGEAAIIRRFTFGINPVTFKQAPPTKQELFNSHLKGIEIALWRDGMKIMTEVEPKIGFEKSTYHIYVGARPMKGHMLTQRPQTLSEIAHG